MKSKLYKLLPLALALMVFLGACGGKDSSRSANNGRNVDGGVKGITIAASFYPMYIMTLNVAKDIPNVRVVDMTKSATGCLHDYSVTPDDMKNLEDARFLVVNGAEMESFMDKVLDQFPHLKTIDSSKEVEAPKIHKPDDIIVKLTTSAICGSDLHLIHGMVPNLPVNYIIGHEPMGIVEETGPEVTKVKKGDRVIVPFNVACGECYYCKHDLTSQCDNSNPHGGSGGYFGYSETFGGYPGGQAEYMRVPFGNFTPFRIPDNCEMEDEKLVLLADAMSTAYWSVDHAGVKNGDTVVVLGCGPVGLLAQKFCWLKGAGRVIAVDYVDYRLEHAKRHNGVEAVNFEQDSNIGEYLKDLTKGGADVVIDCVGMDGKMTPLEFLATGLKLHAGAMGAIVIATQAVRKGGTIQLTGAYGARYNAFPLGDIFNRNIDLKTGQAPVIPYMPYLYNLMAENKVDPSDIITHRLPLDQAKEGYKVFDTKTDNCIKVVLKPWVH